MTETEVQWLKELDNELFQALGKGLPQGLLSLDDQKADAAGHRSTGTVHLTGVDQPCASVVTADPAAHTAQLDIDLPTSMPIAHRGGIFDTPMLKEVLSSFTGLRTGYRVTARRWTGTNAVVVAEDLHWSVTTELAGTDQALDFTVQEDDHGNCTFTMDQPSLSGQLSAVVEALPFIKGTELKDITDHIAGFLNGNLTIAQVSLTVDAGFHFRRAGLRVTGPANWKLPFDSLPFDITLVNPHLDLDIRPSAVTGVLGGIFTLGNDATLTAALALPSLGFVAHLEAGTPALGNLPGCSDLLPAQHNLAAGHLTVAGHLRSPGRFLTMEAGIDNIQLTKDLSLDSATLRATWEQGAGVALELFGSIVVNDIVCSATGLFSASGLWLSARVANPSAVPLARWLGLEGNLPELLDKLAITSAGVTLDIPKTGSLRMGVSLIGETHWANNAATLAVAADLGSSNSTLNAQLTIQPSDDKSWLFTGTLTKSTAGWSFRLVGDAGPDGIGVDDLAQLAGSSIDIPIADALPRFHRVVIQRAPSLESTDTVFELEGTLAGLAWQGDLVTFTPNH
ncbi:hypothetical protein ABZ611_31300 [Streptomyces sp. NPDC007861]|uniref:hypothetical protein n=1 Tax=Streptomyces sp. NPDC007861 TaxID=3154893 RepID=UPI0033D66656